MLGVWMGLYFLPSYVELTIMNKQEEGLFGIWNEVHIVVIWIILLIDVFGGIVSIERSNKKFKNLEKKIEKSLDNKPIEIKIEGSWEQFGKLTFSDSVLTKDD